MKWPVKWSAKTIYVDEETGEQITKHNATTNYKIIQTKKHAKITNESKTTGIIEYTRICRSKRQGELPFNNP